MKLEPAHAQPTEIDPIAESAARHLRRAMALLTAGQRVFARLYLVLLALASRRSADVTWTASGGGQGLTAKRRARAEFDAADSFERAHHEAGFGALGVEESHLNAALAAVAPLPLDEHPYERLGSVVASIWKHVPNPHWDNREVADGGFQIRVEARLKDEAYVDTYLAFPDAARSSFSASKLCPSIEEGKVYAGKIAALFDALIQIDQQANDIALPGRCCPSRHDLATACSACCTPTGIACRDALSDAAPAASTSCDALQAAPEAS